MFRKLLYKIKEIRYEREMDVSLDNWRFMEFMRANRKKHTPPYYTMKELDDLMAAYQVMVTEKYWGNNAK